MTGRIFSSSSQRTLNGCSWLLLALLGFLLGGFARASAQVPLPVLSMINPNTAYAGSAGFTLMATGRPISRTTIIQWNGQDRLTNISDTGQGILTTEITAADLLVPGTVLVTIKNAAGISTPIRFTILPAPPTLTAVTPNVVAQGARQMRLTLTGRNFRPGAKVNLSNPSADAQEVNTDAVAERVLYVNENTLLAVINVGDRAVIGIKNVDVVNADGTNTGRSGTRTSQPLRIAGQSSLAAPAQTNGIALVYPRNGTVIAQNESLIAQAIVGGAGTGTIAGQWLWDGNVVEQFTTNLTAGERVTIKNTRSIPTQIIGPHTLSVRIITPNQLQTVPIKVIVTPGIWRATRLLLPAAWQVVKNAVPPIFEWAIVPGVVKYQIGFAEKPYFNAIQRWIDVGDSPWQVPTRVWQLLPTGKLYWTVRAVEATGNARPPALLRTMWRMAETALQPSAFRAGDGSLRWQEAASGLIYRITVSTDAGAKTVLRRFLTTDSTVDIRLLLPQFEKGQEYFWQVEVFAPNGMPLQTGVATKFLPRPAESLNSLNWKVDFRWLASVAAARQRNQVRYQIASLKVPPLPTPTLTQEERFQFVERIPAPDASLAESTPIVVLQLKEAWDATASSLLVDDTDVTALTKVQGNRLTCPTALPLKAGEHTIAFRVGDKTEQWNFTIAPPSENSTTVTAPATDAEDDVSSAQQQEDAETEAARKFNFNYEITSNTQAVSGSEQEANIMSLALQSSYRDGPWLSEVNGTIALNSLLTPNQAGLAGLVNDYVFRLAHIKERWETDVRFGLTMPRAFLGSEFVTTAFPRLGAEAGLNTPVGNLTFYRNVDDQAPGVGEGLAFHQTIQGASYALPLPKDRAHFRLLWLSSEDRGLGTKFASDPSGMLGVVPDPFVSPAKSDSFGGLLQWQLSEQWQWTSEYALASFNPNRFDPESVRQSGRAWRSQLAGLWRETAINLGWRDVAPGFLSNLNAAYTPFSPNNRRGLDLAVSRATAPGRLAATYQFLQSDLHSADHFRTTLHHVAVNFSRTVTPNTVVTVEGDTAHTATNNTLGVALAINPNTMFFPSNQLRTGLKAAVSHHRNNFTFTVDGVHNWFRDRVNTEQNTSTTGFNVNGQWQPNANFQLVASYGLNAINGAQSNNNRAMSVYVQPVFLWRRAGLTLIPLLSYNKMLYSFDGLKTEEMRMAQYGGRVMWQLPKRLRFSTFSFEASMQRMNPSLQSPLQVTPRILFNWTVIWPPPAPQQ